MENHRLLRGEFIGQGQAQNTEAFWFVSCEPSGCRQMSSTIELIEWEHGCPLLSYL